MGIMQVAADVLDPELMLSALRKLRHGDFTARLPGGIYGVEGEIARAFNEIAELNQTLSAEYTRTHERVCGEGQIARRVRVTTATGSWGERNETVNTLIGDLVWPTTEIARVIELVARGDLTQRMSLAVDGVPLRGEFLRIAKIVNAMVEQLNGFASEVARVAREVGTDGKLGGQAVVPGVAGTWKDLTDNVNSMAANLTSQVRNIAEVTTAVARGDLTRKITVDVRGEILELKSTTNTMVDQLNAFASEVTRMAREVGTEGKLGGQARVPGAAGLWREVTDNVNQLAANLTNQVRAIADVATSVTKGDLTRSIAVEAMGEVAALKDTINEMIGNLKDTTRKNNEQDWLKTHLANVTRMLQGHSDLATVSKLVLAELAPLVEAQQGVFYMQRKHGADYRLELLASYASRPSRHLPKSLRMGEGLIGQCALDKRRILLADVPDDYVRISSALRHARPMNVVILPVLFEGEIKAVVELASLRPFSDIHLSFLDQLTESIGVVFNTIEANMRTESLLGQSQLLTRELQLQQLELKETNDRLEQQAHNLQKSERLLKAKQEELQSTNEQLEEKAQLLSEQMTQIGFKNSEVEQARAALEEKAAQLALSSRYKSVFLANMSHELRTPLNSLLILAKILSDNSGRNLAPRQIEYAQTIYAAGNDLLSMINDILDLAKIESGTVTLDIAPQRFSELGDYVERTFRQVAQGKGLAFSVNAAPGLPAQIITDGKRLQQILKNLVSNAIKFTERGEVTLDIFPAKDGWTPGHKELDQARMVIGFAVRDTGIGIAENSRKLIFEAFQQADGATSRKFGGTGLGLSISRELTRLLDGDIQLESTPGEGSTFRLYIPLIYERRGTGVAAATAPAVVDNPVVRRPDAGAGGHLVAAVARPPVLRPPLPAATVLPLNDGGALADSATRAEPATSEPLALVIEDDVAFARILRDIALESGFRGAIAPDAGTALRMVRDEAPDAITLDLSLPDMDGWAVLDMLKSDPATRHIPVCVIASDERAHRALHNGAIAVVKKPGTREALQAALAKARAVLTRPAATVLVADGSGDERANIVDILSGMAGVEVFAVESGEHVLESLRQRRPDCIVLGQTLADLTAVALLQRIVDDGVAPGMPIVIHSTAAWSPGDRESLDALPEIVVVKHANTVEGVLAEVTLFLHQPVAELPPDRRERLGGMRKTFWELSGRKVLIIDDDIRNIFALTGAIEEHGLVVLNAESALEGIALLKANPDIDAVLMDITMPEVDGYQAIGMIRAMEQFCDLTIVAVTAKAMKGDCEKCIAAGASDYVAKPVHVEQLMALLRARLA